LILQGRRKIVSEYKSEDLKDFNNLVKLLNISKMTHDMNKVEIDYLVNYKNGRQPILDKEKIVRPEINNILIVNHAQMITRSINGYFLGTPIQYIQNGKDNKEEIDLLNRFVAFEDKSSVDKEIGEFQSICGTGYRIIFTDGQFADEIPFEDRALNPATTYVVYENTIAEKPLCGVTYFNLYDDHNGVIGTKVYVYTDFGLYEIIGGNEGFVSIESVKKLTPYDVGGVPIIEYPNNIWRIGDWELCIGLMDQINDINSGRLDDIDQIVQSLLVFINADIDSTRYAEMREAGAITLRNTTTNPADVKSITNTLDQSGMNLFAQELESTLYALVGIPDRKNRAGGGGDTGTAVELRDGWADLEIVARNKELIFKKSEKQALRIILKIISNKLGVEISLLDVDIKFSRNKNNNLLVKCQSFTQLLSTKTVSPADALTIVDLVSDVNEFVSRGEAFWGDSFAGLVQADLAIQNSTVALETAKNPPEQIKPVQTKTATNG
jgi:SPP1 family phage portal protein